MTAQLTHFRCGGLMFEGKQDGGAIPPTLRCALEKVLSSDLSSVRLRTDPGLEGLGALSCMQGEDVYLSRSAPALDTPAGVAVLGHELAHVLQQRAGRVIARAGNLVVEDDSLEAEADRIGLHCAAQLFPGIVNDPGMPKAASGGERLVLGCEPAPIQFLIPSTQSYADFVVWSWNYLITPLAINLSAPQNMTAMYNYAATYNPNGVAPKNPLAGIALYGEMAGYMQATVPNQVVMQTGNNWPDITAQVGTLVTYYTNKSNGIVVPVNPTGEQLKTRYLHVYPNVQAQANWRIGLNVLPFDMANAMGAFAPMLNQYVSIDHMKFLSPGNASKADSVIVYCDHNGIDYAQLEPDVVNAAANLNMQARVAAMWEEIAPGIGLASEPPMGGTSFTEYRVMITYLTFLVYVVNVLQAGGNPTFAAFNTLLDAVMAMFGINVAAPHDQGPVQGGNPAYANWQAALNTLRAMW